MSYHWYSNLIGSDVHIRTNDRACSVIHTFSHHVLPEQTIFLLQELRNTFKRDNHFKTLLPTFFSAWWVLVLRSVTHWPDGRLGTSQSSVCPCRCQTRCWRYSAGGSTCYRACLWESVLGCLLRRSDLSDWSLWIHWTEEMTDLEYTWHFSKKRCK